MADDLQIHPSANQGVSALPVTWQTAFPDIVLTKGFESRDKW
jgi:hypothetical protein